MRSDNYNKDALEGLGNVLKYILPLILDIGLICAKWDDIEVWLKCHGGYLL